MLMDSHVQTGLNGPAAAAQAERFLVENIYGSITSIG